MLKIEIYKKAITTKEGKSFDVFKCIDKMGKKVDLKFTKAVKNLPDDSGFIYVEDDKINLDTHSRYPVYWVKGVENYERFERTNKAFENFNKA